MNELLQTGAFTIIGRHPNASNAAYVMESELTDTTVRALYKPVAGERALWDFPGVILGRREVAAYELAMQLGIPHIPPTVWREDLPLGPGSLQLWIDDATIADVVVTKEVDPGWLHILDAELTDGTAVQVVHRDVPELRTVALLDAIMNNGDRKAGHLLRDPEGGLWVVDHGVTFHVEPKLRTVLWGFALEPIEPPLLERLDLDVRTVPALRAALSDAELQALAGRMAHLRQSGRYPIPSEEWPSIPWPIF